MKPILPLILRAALLAAIFDPPPVCAEAIPDNGNVTTMITINDGSTTTVTRLWVNSSSTTVPASLTLNGAHLKGSATSTTSCVGYSGSGSLSILGGGTAYLGPLSFGHSSGSQGTGLVDGNGSTLTTTGQMSVGYYGNGTLTISDGGVVDVGYYLLIGNKTGKTGDVLVTGVGSTLKAASTINVGGYGTGTLTVNEAGKVRVCAASSSDSSLVVGVKSGSDGTVVVTGFESTITTNTYVVVGHGGTGSMTISDGAIVDIEPDSTDHGALLVGYQSGSHGTVDVIGSTLTANAGVAVGFSGIGELRITEGGTMKIENNSITSSILIIGRASSGKGSAEVSGLGASLSSNSTISVGFYGTGTLTIRDGATLEAQMTSNRTALEMGYYAGSSGTVTVTGEGTSLKSNAWAYVGYYGKGSLTVSDGASMTVEQSSWTSAAMTIGAMTSGVGSVTVSGVGSFLSINSYMSVGYSGTGNMTISQGGTTNVAVPNTIYSSIMIGYNSGATGALLVTGEGSTLTTNTGICVGSSGNGTLTISNGATVNTQRPSTGKIMQIAAGAGSTGAVLVTGVGSTLTTNTSIQVAGSGTGSLTVTDAATVSILNNSLTIGAYSNSLGSVWVDGLGASLTANSMSHVGYLAGSMGSLTISNGGSVTFWGTSLRDSSLVVGLNPTSNGTILVTGNESVLTSRTGLNIGYYGSGSLTVSDGGTVNITPLESEDFYSNETQMGSGEGTVSVTGEGSRINVNGLLDVATLGNGTLNIEDNGVVDVSGETALMLIGSTVNIGATTGSGTLNLGNGATAQVNTAINSYGGVLTMDSSSTLISSSLYVAKGSMSTITLGGTNRLGDVSIDCVDGSSDLTLTLLASGMSVSQGGIVVCNQLMQTEGSDAFRTEESMINWANVSVELDLCHNAEDLIGSRVYLIKEGAEYENFGDGLLIENEKRAVDTDHEITFVKEANGNYYTLNYVYDGVSLTFGDTVTITPVMAPISDDEDEPGVGSIEVTTKVVPRHIIGTIETEGELLVFTPNAGLDDAKTYDIAEGVDAEKSLIEIATTSYLKEIKQVYKSADGVVLNTVISVSDLGVSDLTLYVNAFEETISGGVVGLNHEDEDPSNGEHAMINNILVEYGGTLVLEDKTVVNADRSIQADKGTIILDNATVKIGGGNLNEFRENEVVKNSNIDWEGLATSSIENSTIVLTNGSSINFARVLDDAVATTAFVNNSTIDISDTSTIHVGNGVDMTVTNSTIKGVGKLSTFASSHNTYTAGKNSVGVLELVNVRSSNDTMGTTIVGSKVVSEMLNNDTSNVISQLKLSGSTTVNNGTFQLDVVGDSSLLVEGTSFQVLDLENPLDGGFTSFTETGTPLLDGYVWDYSLLNSEGIVSVILAELDEGTRIANTMYSSAKTVSYAGATAMNHVANIDATTDNNFWMSSLGNYQCVGNHSGRTGYTFRSMGYAVGYDRAFGNSMIEGVAAGQTWGKHYPKQGSVRYSAGKIDQDAMLATLYGKVTLLRTSEGVDEINLLHAGSYGVVHNKSLKTSMFSNKTATAKWDDHVWNFGIRALWNHRFNEHWTLSPFVEIDYEYVAQNSMTERLGNTTAHYRGGNYQNWQACAGTSASYTVRFDNNMALTPMASVAYVTSFARNTPTLSVNTGYRQSIREKAVTFGHSALEATAGLDWEISNSVHLNAAYSFNAARNNTTHNASVTMSYTF